MKATEAVKAPRLGSFGGSGLRMKKSGESSATDAEALRAARLRKYEAFHGTGKSLSGLQSTFASTPSSSGMRLGGGNTTSGVAPAEISAAAESKQEQEETEEKKPAVPFQGQGRRLR